MYASSGENSCVGAASSVSLEGERELISLGEVEQNAKRSERQYLRTNRSCRPGPCLSYYITIIHGDNTSHAATAVIWKQIDRIYKFSVYLRRDPPWPQSSLSTFFFFFGVRSRWRRIRSCCRLFQDNLVLNLMMEVFFVCVLYRTCCVCFLWNWAQTKREKEKKPHLVWFYNWPYLLLHAKLINPSGVWDCQPAVCCLYGRYSGNRGIRLHCELVYVPSIQD